MKPGVILRFLVFSAAAGVPLFACQGGRVENCKDMGAEWTECPGLPNVCVLEKTKAKSCQVAAGSATSTSPTVTPPATTDAGLKCSSFETLCGTTCVDVKSDDDNCGGCNKVCANSTSCFNGTCR